MQGWTVVVAAALVLDVAVRAVADVLQLRALRPDVPAEFSDVYDAERYGRAQVYARARIRLGLVEAGVHVLVVLAFWAAGGFGVLDRTSRDLGGGPVATGLLVLGALALGDAALRLPGRWYATFVVEERFGFNRTTPGTFWTDVAKGALLAIVVGGPLLALVLWLFDRLGDAAWWWAWLAGTAWIVAIQYVAPTWILPLFHRFTPLPPGTLGDAIVAYARRVGFPLAGVSVIDGSRRSTKANAFFTGFGAHKRIALFDTMLATLSPEQVLAVVAHEVGHYRLRHVVRGLVIAVVHLGAMLLLVSLVIRLPGLLATLGFAPPSVHGAFVAFALLSAPIALPVSLALNWLSRAQERRADRFAAETTGDGRALAEALKHLSADSLATLTPHPLYVALHHSHPPVVERVRLLASRAGGGGD